MKSTMFDPHSGAAIAVRSRKQPAWKRLAVCLATLACLTIGGATAYREMVIIPEMRSMILPYLKDPVSAQFRNETFSGYGTAGYYCGEVNARGEMGGYQGFREFRAFSGGAVRFSEPDEARTLSECQSYDNQSYFGWLYFLARAKVLQAIS